MTLCRLRRQSPGDHIAMTVQVFVGECRLKAPKAPPRPIFFVFLSDWKIPET